MQHDFYLFHIQGFDWESYYHNPSWWIHFQSKVEDLFELGVTDVWLPPASQSVDKQGQSIQPLTFTIQNPDSLLNIQYMKIFATIITA